jgi:hypothetical protein
MDGDAWRAQAALVQSFPNHPSFRRSTLKTLFLVLLLAVSILLPFAAHARASVPVESPQQVTFVVSKGGAPTIEKVRESIGSAGSVHGWQVTSEQPGEVTMHNLIRNKFVVVVNVFYDSKGVRVDYVSSENLNYALRGGVAYIHPKYNEWVKLLLKDIVARVSA